MTTRSDLGNELLRAAARLTRWASRHASFDVPFAQARLLALVDELGPARISDLAHADNTSQPTMTTQVQRVEAAGWVARHPDPDDARATLVELTPAGRSALESVRAARLAVLAPALEQLDGPSMERVRVAVDVITDLVSLASEPPRGSTAAPTRED